MGDRPCRSRRCERACRIGHESGAGVGKRRAWTIAVALTALLAVPQRAHGLDPARDLTSYALFGYEALSFKGDDAGGPTQTRGLITGGNVGVNAVDPRNPPTPLLTMCGGGSGHRVWMSDG